MDNKTAVILALAVAAAVVLSAGGVYAMMGRGVGSGTSYLNASYRSGMGRSMMGGSYGCRGGMTGGSMMGAGCGPSSMMEDMQQYMRHYWNSTSAP